MSIKVMASIWEASKASGTDLLMLLALADHADDEGVCWPGVPRLAHKTRQSERNARRQLRKLEEAGELYTQIGGGRGNSNLYLLAAGRNQDKLSGILASRFGLTRDKAQQMLAKTKGGTDTPVTEKGTSGDERGTSGDVKGDTAVSAESSLTIMEPSVTPAPAAQGLDELEYVPIEGDEFGESVPGQPKWARPETAFHRAFLGVCRAKWFQPRQKTKVKKLSMCLSIGDVLTEADCCERCLEELAGCDNFPDKPIAMPASWYAWRVEHAKANRWSVDGFIKALFDRDALVRHCQVKLKKAKVPVKPETTEEYAARTGKTIV